MQRIEDAGYSLGGSMFGKAIRSENTDGYIELDELFYVRDTPEECYLILEQFMEANPVVCGIAMEFDPNVYSDVESTYGFTPYVTRVTGKFEHLDLGMVTNSYEWDWWTLPCQIKKACWVSPFRDSSVGHVIACYAIPVLLNGQVFAVIAIDIDTEAFTEKSKEISPYPGASTTMLDRSFRFIVVGVMPDFPYRKEEKVLNPGDMLFTYTDGLTEAENSDKTLFGDDATLSALENAINNGIDSVKAYVESMYEAVLHHTAGAEQNDDITMMAIEYKGPSADIRK